MGQKGKQKPPEYRLHLFRHTDPESGKHSVVLVLLTVKEFASFNYEILLDAGVRDHTLNLKILGMHAPRSLMPGSGPARGFRQFTDLQGPWTINLQKSARETAQIEIDVHGSAVRILRTRADPFLLVSTDPVSF